MPNNTSANTLSIVGGKPSAWDKTADPNAHTEPLSWSDSLKYGHYLLDDKGRLLPEIEEIFRMAHDQDAAIFFGHPTKPEYRAMADFSQKIGFKKRSRRSSLQPLCQSDYRGDEGSGAAGLWLNFTFDELSPLLGIDPANMYKAIRTVGPEHCTLSSDAGEPLFPNSVESLRLLRGYMSAFGCTADEIYTDVHREPGLHRRTQAGNEAKGERGPRTHTEKVQIGSSRSRSNERERFQSFQPFKKFKPFKRRA